MKITLLAGGPMPSTRKAAISGRATYRAVRQGLMMAESVLLSRSMIFDWRFRRRTWAGRSLIYSAWADRRKRRSPTEKERWSEAACRLPLWAAIRRRLLPIPKGQGRLFCTLKGYEPCHNAEEVIEEKGYRPGQDLENPASSVFCSHGAGTVIPWNQVRDSYACGQRLEAGGPDR